MSVYVYAISERAAKVPGCLGIGEQELRLVRAGGLAALVSDEPGLSSETEQDLWQHERAVEGLMAAGHDVLPMRFGTVVADEQAVAALLRERAGEFAAGLERVAGSVELAIRAVLYDRGADAADRPDRERPGTRYLGELKQREDLADRVEQRLRERLAPLARASRYRRLRAAPPTIASAHLVAQEQLEEFRAGAAELAEETDFAEVFCTGPWPPYSFVGAEGGG